MLENQTMLTNGEANTEAGQQPATTATENVATDATTNSQQADATDTKATGDQPAKAESGDGQNEGGDAKDTKPEGAPETYEFKAPEGIEFDPEVIAPYTEVAKELGLTQEAAQTILEKMAPVMQSRQEAVLAATAETWKDLTTNDKEFGGEKLAENLAVAKRALDTFGTPELSKLLAQSRLGNHPEVIRMFYRAGKTISEDTAVMGGNVSAPRNAGEIVYPSMLKQS